MDRDWILDNIIRREGSEFSNRKNDRGGATKFGITQLAWTGYRREGMKRNVEEIDESEARSFYQLEYITQFEWITDDDLCDLVIDCAILHSKARSIRWIQLAAGTAPDGIAGMLTRIAVNGQKDVYPKVLQSRFKFLAKIATDQENDPDAEFLPGWINRCCEFIR